MGYLCDEERTRAAFDDDGWLHTGDCGRKDQDGFIFITGRLKGFTVSCAYLFSLHNLSSIDSIFTYLNYKINNLNCKQVS